MSPDRATHRSLIRVRYAETDAMRFVYYANHFVYYEVARTEWLEVLGFPYDDLELRGIALPVIAAHCEYRAPARYGDRLAVDLAMTEFDGLRIRFDYRTSRDDASGTLLAEGWTRHVCMDMEGRPKRPPEELRAALRAISPAG